MHRAYIPHHVSVSCFSFGLFSVMLTVTVTRRRRTQITDFTRTQNRGHCMVTYRAAFRLISHSLVSIIGKIKRKGVSECLRLEWTLGLPR
jgi:hypothetical protein